MNKTELVSAIANGAGITKAAAGRVLDTFTTTIIEALKDGNSIVLPGFGTFKTGHRAERMGRNPQTGAAIKIKACRVAKFTPGKQMRDEVK